MLSRETKREKERETGKRENATRHERERDGGCGCKCLFGSIFKKKKPQHRDILKKLFRSSIGVVCFGKRKIHTAYRYILFTLA